MKIKSITLKFAGVLLLLLLVTGCAEVSNVQRCVEGTPAGFWDGILNGLAAPFAMIGSIFRDDLAIYTVNNNGGWYNLGFLFGLSMISGLFGGGAARRRKKRVSA